MFLISPWQRERKTRKSFHPGSEVTWHLVSPTSTQGWWVVGVWCVGGEREVASMSVSRIQGHGQRGERRLDIHPSNTVKDA